MKRLTGFFSLLLLALAIAPAAASASEFDQYAITSASASLSNYQAGAHADFTTEFSLKTSYPNGDVSQPRDIVVELPPGILGNPNAFPKCTMAQLAALDCPLDSQVGVTEYSLLGGSGGTVAGLYNMETSEGLVARFGFKSGFVFPTTINARLRPGGDGVTASVEGIPSAVALTGARTTLWGVPASPAHDLERMLETDPAPPGTPRPSKLPPIPFMTNPTRCGVSQTLKFSSDTYQLPGQYVSREAALPPLLGCGSLEFSPEVSLKPTTTQGTTGSGLDYELDLPTKGLEADLTYGSELKRAEVILPEGMTLNPSEAEGLGICSEADFERETPDSGPDEGCPGTSKVGSVTATSPVVDLPATGSLYLAKPYSNPFGSLLALYMVLKIPERGVLVKMAGEVKLDPATGQITTIFDNVPQLPVAEFHLHFREGARAPLVTPPDCGVHEGLSQLSPWSVPGRITTQRSPFAIESGPDHGPCPTGGLPPFHPGLVAGSVNNAAGSFSPFDVRLTRGDAEQEITHFSIKLPPGLLAKLAGIPRCSDAAIAAAAARKGRNGAQEELDSPSCPAASQVGRTLVGAGVGSILTYVPGKVYLAGPYHGAPISIVAVTSAKAGPFDLGTVVVREALRVNPETAEVFVDATGSDPIPHIIQGVPVHLRDVRVYVDRPNFTLNPTDCTRTSTASTVLGAGLDFASEADDNPLVVSTPFQAADCAALGFRPKLALEVAGPTHRGGVPKFKATLTYPKSGPNANIAKSVLTLPFSEILEQGHIGTSCTRVQFNEGGGNGEKCPAASIYGRARAITPLLDEPLEGPVFLRSNGGERNLPDLVAALHGAELNVDLVGFIDAVQKKGAERSRIRNTFAAVPDAPVEKFVLEMKGGSKGLLVNTTNICKGAHRAVSVFTGQNGKRYETKPEVVAKGCGKKGKGAKRHGKGKGSR
jgi:hypothetical protein